MAAVTKGQAHLYGITGTITNATVLSFQVTSRFNNNDETQNESGVGIEVRLDDRREDATITIRMRSGYTVPAIGTELTYNTVKYWIEEITRNETNNGFRELTMNIKNAEGITLA
jgi:hypothetical protein